MPVEYVPQAGVSIDATNQIEFVSIFTGTGVSRGVFLHNNSLFAFVYKNFTTATFYRSQDGGVTWVELDGGNAPAATAATAIVAPSGVLVAWNDNDGGGGSGLVTLQVFNLTTLEWEPAIETRAGYDMQVLSVVIKSDGNIIVLNQSNPIVGSSGLTASLFDPILIAWTDVDVMSSITALGGYDATVNLKGASSLLDSDDTLHVFAAFTGDPAEFTNIACFYSQFLTDNSVANFFTFPGTYNSPVGEGDIHDSAGQFVFGLPTFANGFLCVGITRNNPAYFPASQANYATLYTSADDGVTWVRLDTGIDPTNVNARQYTFDGIHFITIPFDYAEWPPCLFYDGETLYAIYSFIYANTDNPTFSPLAKFIRLCTATPVGDPSTWVWSCSTIQSAPNIDATSSFTFPQVSIQSRSDGRQFMFVSSNVFNAGGDFASHSFWFGDFVPFSPLSPIRQFPWVQLPFCLQCS